MPDKSELDSKIQKEELFAAYDIAKAILTSTFDLDVLYKLGVICSRIGRISEAQGYLSQYISRGGSEPFARLNLAHMLKAQQNFSEAALEYKTFISDNPNFAGHGWWHLSDLKDFKVSSGELELLESNKSKLQKDNPDRMLMDFALGTFYERTKEFDKAFSSFDDANSLHRSLKPFNREAFHKLVANLNQLKSIPHFEFPASVIPIFIVGMPRSGSTLHEQILCSHSQVQATDELPFINAFAAGMERTGSYATAIASLDRKKADQLRKQYLESTSPYRIEDKTYFIDKSPINFIHIGLVKSIFPEAIIINTYRNTFANAMSIYKRYFYMGNEYAYHLDDIADYMSGYVRLMNLWERILPGEIIHCQYESLIEDPETKIRELIAACKLPFEENCLTFYQNKRSILTPSVDQVSKPIYKSAVDSWEIYNKHISEQQRVKLTILNKQYELYFNNQEYINKNHAWSDYWSQGNRTSFTANEIYDGAIKGCWESLVKQVVQPVQILDLCTGNGALPFFLANAIPNKHSRIVGVDSATINASLERKSENPTIEFIGDTEVENLPFDNQLFDLVVSQFGVEYVNLSLCVPEVGRVLKVNGSLRFVCHSSSSQILKENVAIFECSKLIIKHAMPYLGEVLKGMDLSLHETNEYQSVTEFSRAKFNEEMGALSQCFGETLFHTGFPNALKYLLSQKNKGNAFVLFGEYLVSLKVAQERLKQLFEAALDDEKLEHLINLLGANGFEVQKVEDLMQGEFLIGKIIEARKIDLT